MKNTGFKGMVTLSDKKLPRRCVQNTENIGWTNGCAEEKYGKIDEN